jgi:UDP-N-acetyl-D-galactosamine dehydrogenase
LGYVGLPLAVEFSKKIPVIGFDINNDRITELKNGRDYTNELTSKELIAAGDIIYTSKQEDITSCNYYIVTVPTPIDHKKNPDFSPLINASKFVGI